LGDHDAVAGLVDKHIRRQKNRQEVATGMATAVEQPPLLEERRPEE